MGIKSLALPAKGPRGSEADLGAEEGILSVLQMGFYQLEGSLGSCGTVPCSCRS